MVHVDAHRVVNHEGGLDVAEGASRVGKLAGFYDS